VAVVLSLLDAAKAKSALAPVMDGDKRLKLLKVLDADLDDHEDAAWEEEEGDESESAPPRRGRNQTGSGGGRLGSSRRQTESERILREHFEAMSKEELVAFAVEQAAEQREIGRGIIEQAQLKGGKIRKLVASLRDEIETLTRRPAWVNSWTGEGERPDYGHVQSQLVALLDAGHADDVVSLGKDLWRLGNRQIGQSNDEGETAGQIGECMEVVLRAIHRSALSPPDRLLLIIESCLADEYSCLSQEWSAPQGKRYGRESWRSVAKTLEERLGKLPLPAGDDDKFSIRYRREHLLRWVTQACERAGRRRDVIPLLEREAEATLCYEELVERLVAAKRVDDARAWAIKGFKATAAKWAGIAASLEAKLREMARAQKDWATVTAYRAYEFFDQPSLQSYLVLQKAAEQVGVWDPVRGAALQYLQSGARADLAPSDGMKGSVKGGGWPLPALEIASMPTRKVSGRFPDTGTLIDIAVHEKRNDDVVRYYEAYHKDRWGAGSRGVSVAEAIKDTHPDVALGIWKQLLEAEANSPNPVVYEQAVRFLNLMRALYERIDRSTEWQAYVTDLRVRRKAKHSLMKVLDKIEGIKHPPKRIIDT
jgi:uncharacterized Zn finger protein